MAPSGKQPRHKPSPRHTLQEVLRSLQDMVRNELAAVEPRPVEPPPAPAPPIRTPADIEAGLSQVLTVLPSQTGTPQDAATPSAPAAAIEQPQPPPPAPAVPAAALEPEPLVLTPAPPPAPVTPEPPPEPPPVRAAKRPQPADRQLKLPIFESAPPAEPVAPVAAVHAEPAQAVPAEAPVPDDIPVLRDAVFVPPTRPPPAPAPPVQIEIPLPPPDTAREIAIQVAARLNVELRQSGRRGLSSEAILRLTQLLREALAQAATNVDNTPQPDRTTER
jgi:hypothetical protein